MGCVWIASLHHGLRSLHTGGSVSLRVTGRALPFSRETSCPVFPISLFFFFETKVRFFNVSPHPAISLPHPKDRRLFPRPVPSPSPG